MNKKQKFLFWAVVTMAAAVTISGLTYSIISFVATLSLNVFGRMVPAGIIGIFTTYWGVRMLYRLYHLPWRQGTAGAH
jgi:hypothetical protein